MNKRNIVIGFHRPEKQERAKTLRKEMTSIEVQLWEKLRSNKLGGLHFRRQQVVDGFIADFYCHKAGLILELDGSIHANQREYDAERDAIIASRGLTILRISNERIENDLDNVLAEIHALAIEQITLQE